MHYAPFCIYEIGINKDIESGVFIFCQAPEFVFRDLKLSPDKEAVTIMVDFESIRLETMIKFKDQTKV